MEADKAREVLLNAAPCDILYFDNRQFVTVGQALNAIATARTDALREAAELLQARANIAIDAIKNAGKVTTGLVTVQLTLEEAVKIVLSLIKEPTQ